MGEDRSGLVTQILQAAGSGRDDPAADLLPLLYEELRKLASSLMVRTPPGNTLQPTALVHEAYMRLVRLEDPGWNGKGHFFAAAAQAMRRILVEQARRKAAVKHGGKQKRQDLDIELIPFDTADIDILALDEALQELQAVDPRKVDVVLLRFLTGLTIEETAAALGISAPTVERDWRFARAYLFERIGDREIPEGGRSNES
jgi:RNA polymerase sigma factor (TIGR02999 family)